MWFRLLIRLLYLIFHCALNRAFKSTFTDVLYMLYRYVYDALSLKLWEMRWRNDRIWFEGWFQLLMIVPGVICFLSDITRTLIAFTVATFVTVASAVASAVAATVAALLDKWIRFSFQSSLSFSSFLYHSHVITGCQRLHLLYFI